MENNGEYQKNPMPWIVDFSVGFSSQGLSAVEKAADDCTILEKNPKI